MWTKSTNELPATGIPVIAYVTNAYGNGMTRRVLAFYASEKFLPMLEDFEDEDRYDEKDDAYYCDAGWYEHIVFGEVYNSIDGDVTHWIELPDEPSKEGQLVITQTSYVQVSDWDDLVHETYGKPYSFQQQDGCPPRGTFGFTVPEEAYDYENDTLPEIVNHEEVGVSFKAWKARDPNKSLKSMGNERVEPYAIAMWWDRNFYPEFQTIANDLHKKGLIKAGSYLINIDW